MPQRSPQQFELLFALLEQTEAGAEHFTGRGIAVCRQLRRDKLIKMIAESD